MPKGKVFLTWSGERSKDVAKALRSWLPDVIQNLDPWMSEDDIDKGARWATEISGELGQCKIGIICLTPENLKESWINFEAGALSKLPGSYVCTYLLDLATSNVPYPLAQFQATRAERDETKKLLFTINKAMGDDGLNEQALTSAFRKWWPELDATLSQVTKQVKAVAKPKRTVDDMLEELINLAREESHSRAAMTETLQTVLAAITGQQQAALGLGALASEMSTAKSKVLASLLRSRMGLTSDELVDFLIKRGIKKRTGKDDDPREDKK